MAEQGTTTALVPIRDNEYSIEVNEFTPAGKKNSYAITVPNNLNTASIPVMVLAAMLKEGGGWRDKSLASILVAIAYADRMGLDIVAGDVYIGAEGRISTTAAAKIRHAMASGRIAGYKVVIERGADIEIPWETAKQKGVWKGPDLTATVTVKVKGWDEPVVYTARLREWFIGSNPNWRLRTEHMLRLNALSKAMAEVAPMGVEADEAPPVETPTVQYNPTEKEK